MNARFLSPHASKLYRRCRDGTADRNDRRCFSLRQALIVWLILAAAVSVRTLVHPVRHTVFPIFAASVQHWWDDRSLYDVYAGLDRFRYPPVFTLFVTPFSALGLITGGILWSWLSIAVFVAGLWQYARDVVPSSWTQPRLAVFLMLGAFGALRGLWNAQSNALIAGFVLLGSAALARAARGEERGTNRQCQLPGWGRIPPSSLRCRFAPRPSDWWLAAVFLAAAVCLKLTPLAPVLLLAALWPRRLAWRILAVMAGLFLLPFLTRPPGIVLDHYREWIEHLMESGNIRWLGFRDGWTIWIVLRHWLSGEAGGLPLDEPMDSVWYRLMQLATAAAALGWCLWQRHRAGRCGLGPRWLVHATLSMGLAWLMLFGPAVEHATYVFLAPPLLWALLERDAWPHGRGLIWASFTLIMVLGWGAVARLLAPDWPIVLTALPAGAALFALWLLGYAHNCGNQTQGPPTSSSQSRSTTRPHLVPCTEPNDETTIPSVRGRLETGERGALASCFRRQQGANAPRSPQFLDGL